MDPLKLLYRASLLLSAISVLLYALPIWHRVDGCVRAYVWPTSLLVYQVAGHLFIAFSYTWISIRLLQILHRRKDIPVNWIVTCFAAFIFLCGGTHALVIYTMWSPIYWADGTLVALTAAVSVATATLLHWKVTPILLSLASYGDLEKAKRVAEDQRAEADIAKREAQAAQTREAAKAAEVGMVNEALAAKTLEAEDAARRAQAGEHDATEQADRLRAALDAIRELGVVIIRAWRDPSVLLVPIQGVLDTRRIADLQADVLEASVRQQARWVLIDLSGVSAADTAVVHCVLQLQKAIGLIGVQCAFTGIGPAVAQTMATLLDGSTGSVPELTVSSLADGLELALSDIHTKRTGMKRFRR